MPSKATLKVHKKCVVDLMVGLHIEQPDKEGEFYVARSR
jgi:hypothetical protein